MNGLKVLALGAHVDDIEIGCGGTLAQHILNGDIVKTITFASSGYVLPDGWHLDMLLAEQQEAMKTLGITDVVLLDFGTMKVQLRKFQVRHTLYTLWRDFAPDIVYHPWRGCWHEDHMASAEIAVQIGSRSPASAYGYSLPNDFTGFTPTYFVELSKKEAMLKLRAVRCYRSQFAFRKWMTENLIKAHLWYYLPFIREGAEWVEAFEVVKETRVIR